MNDAEVDIFVLGHQHRQDLWWLIMFWPDRTSRVSTASQGRTTRRGRRRRR